jgi:membrane protein implicated in regulation of membrane protease activity
VPWWGWIVLGAFLLAVEMTAPMDFYLAFLGLSALLTGAIVALGVREPAWLPWALFAVLSVVSLVWFRERFGARLRAQGSDPRVDDTLVGEIAHVHEALAPGATGRVELRGSTWTARNAEAVPLEAGSRARVERVEGLLLHLRRET